jgi:hypothetical protein
MYWVDPFLEPASKWGVDTAFTSIGFAGPGGALAAGEYFIIDNTYPGGADAYAQILGPNIEQGFKNGTWLP